MLSLMTSFAPVARASTDKDCNARGSVKGTEMNQSGDSFGKESALLLVRGCVYGGSLWVVIG